MKNNNAITSNSTTIISSYEEYEVSRNAVMERLNAGEKVNSSEVAMYDNSMCDFPGSCVRYGTLADSIGECQLKLATDDRHEGALRVVGTKRYLYLYRHHDYPRGISWDDFREEVGDPRRAFARECGRAARRLGVPFHVALAFKKDEKKILAFKRGMEEALAMGYTFDSHELSCGRARAGKEIARLGIPIGDVDPNRLKEYVLDCLEMGVLIAE